MTDLSTEATRLQGPNKGDSYEWLMILHGISNNKLVDFMGVQLSAYD